MFMTGFMVYAGTTLLLVKLPRRTMLKALHHDLLVDLGVSALVLVVHWGTFSGVMAATVAGLLTSITTSGMKKLFGYIQKEQYYPGVFCLEV